MRPEDYEQYLTEEMTQRMEERARLELHPLLALHSDGRITKVTDESEQLAQRVSKLEEALRQVVIVSASAGCESCKDVLEIARNALL